MGLYQRAMASTKRIFGVLDSKPSIDDGDLPASRISVDGDITFENISFGAPDATGEEITEAARTAEAHDFIAALPNGYDTIVGERGQKLSGGQRQRLSLARALLTRSPVLILDEATSAVDNETEAAIQRSLARIAHNRTMVVVAHRLSTIRSADVIYVIDKGRVTQMGTHDDLIAADGIYRTLWNVQTGEAGFAGRTS